MESFCVDSVHNCGKLSTYKANTRSVQKHHNVNKFNQEGLIYHAYEQPDYDCYSENYS